jgi:uncharacterized membrane protein YfcA
MTAGYWARARYDRRPVGAAEIAAIAAAGSVVGAQLAARYGRRLLPQALRAVIVAGESRRSCSS